MYSSPLFDFLKDTNLTDVRRNNDFQMRPCERWPTASGLGGDAVLLLVIVIFEAL